MRASRLLLWGGMILSVLVCVAVLVGGALAVFFAETGSGATAVSMRRLLAGWALGFAGTFALSIVFFILTFRRGALGG